jgi:hypothetical protein
MTCTHTKGYLQVGSFSTDIDLGIYDLIKELWTAKIYTTDACESTENGGVSITFRASLGVEKLLTIINSPDDLDEECSLAERSQLLTMTCLDKWDYDLGFVYSDPSDKFASEIILVIILKFPKSDYDEVLRRVKEYNK